MKQVKLYLFSIALIAFIAACGGNASQSPAVQDQGAAPAVQTEKTEAKPEEQGKEYTSDYVCPMHCEGSGSDKPGACPKCGMDYVKREEQDHDGH